jgi:thiol:disulfide interchange protein DsbC
MRKLLTMVIVPLLTILMIGCSGSSEASVDNAKLMKFIETQVVKNKDVKVLGVEIIEKRKVEELPGWEVLFVNMKLQYNNQMITAPETFFVRDNVITPLVFDMDKNINYRDDIKPTIKDTLYNKEHLVAGNADAKHKILLFSDPQCPFCQEVVPDLLKAARQNPTVLSVYYYHLPLEQIHPVSVTLVKIMEFAEKAGKMDLLEKVYSLQIDPATTDEATIIDEVKKQLGFSVTSAQINTQDIITALQNDKDTASKTMVNGTPTIYIDGKIDKLREGYKDLIAKK